AGLGAALLTYKLARKYLDKEYSLLAAILFYCTPLVGWLSGSAYVDLIRTFFEVLALYLVVSKKYIWAGFAIGLAISTKTLAIGSLAILFLISGFSFRLLAPAILVSAPWFIWSYVKTGYPFYPIGGGILNTKEHSNFLNLFTEDKLNPLFFLVFLNRKNIGLLVYCVLGFGYWLVTPQNGGGRFLLPYLPAFAVLFATLLPRQKILTILAFVFIFFSIIYRFGANLKVIDYLVKNQSKESYLCSHLDFSTNVFVDCDGWFKKNITNKDLVLVKGFHNLYYINFPFVHETWYKGEKVNYILSNTYDYGNLVYKNDYTHTYLYLK
ncbi:hypothetical protein HY310_03525, partial [Candidatus Microgenomates bacterium]|nr:hypothetical protein [Candidatus Microgenomates bacterium]